LEHADERSMVILAHQLNKTQNPAIKKKKKNFKERKVNKKCLHDSYQSKLEPAVFSSLIPIKQEQH
jgi:HKD family nuclease